jgi:peptidoglycan hydrolase-like protein with peptidoglycan-binding domain
VSLGFAAFVANRRFVAAAKNHPPMRLESHGPHVRLLQAALHDLGFKMPKSIRASGVPDGIFGSETHHVLKVFQGTHALKIDGVAGAKTLALVDALMLAKAKPNPTPSFVRPIPVSAEYTLGFTDPPRQLDPGAGAWNSTAKTMVARAQLAAIATVLPLARVTIGEDAVKHMAHYLENSGKPLKIDLEAMVRDVPSAARVFGAEVAQAKAFVEKLGPGTHQITSKRMNGGYNRPQESNNWYFAVGGYNVWGKGTAKIAAGPVDDIDLDFEYCVYDRYNWDNGKSVEIHGIVITDQFMGEFHRQGLAREYDEIGSVKRSFKWRRGLPIPTTQFR